MRDLIRGGDGSGRRDVRVDFLRGLALWFIFLDHVPGNTLSDFTLRNVTLCDATEAFVLLAGFAAGLAYGSARDRNGLGFATVSVLRRVATLYVAHIFLFVVFTAQVGFSARALDSSVYLDEMNLEPFGAAPYRALFEALLLRFQPAFLNILPLYIVLLLLLALALPLLGHTRLLLGLSGALYVLARALDLNLPSWTGGGWFFNPLAWQFLFFIGCTLGYAPPGAARAGVPWRPWLAWLCVLLLVIGAVVLTVIWHRPELMNYVPRRIATVISSIDKTGLHPFRLISILALAYLLGHLMPPVAPWMGGPLAGPFTLIGQHGLVVFCFGIVLSFLGRLALELDDTWPMQLAVNAAGFAAMVGAAWLAAWYDAATRPRGPRPAPAGAAT